jgi:hypothetical protein
LVVPSLVSPSIEPERSSITYISTSIGCAPCVSPAQAESPPPSPPLPTAASIVVFGSGLSMPPLPPRPLLPPSATAAAPPPAPSLRFESPEHAPNASVAMATSRVVMRITRL